MCCSLRGYPSSKRPNVNTLIALGFWLACELTHAEETNVAKTEAETKQSATQLPCHWTAVHVTCNLVVFTRLSVLVWKTAQIPSPRITISSAPKYFLFLWLRPIEPLHVASEMLRFAVRGTVAVFHVSKRQLSKLCRHQNSSFRKSRLQTFGKLKFQGFAILQCVSSKTLRNRRIWKIAKKTAKK